ncbi:MAG: SDR family NAD(P)-dependent oxidoreductase, partial [Bacteroidota bacterium]
MSTTLITGATAGIGRATAERFAAAGHRLILTGRRAERLAKLEAELATDVLTLAFDVRERETVKRVVSELPKDWQAIDLLVNNAGL